MKPIWKSKKALTALATLIAEVLVHYSGNAELMIPLMTIGSILIAGFAAADFGKEAKAIECGKL